MDSYHGSLFVWIPAIWEMSERMTQSNSLGLPKHVATKIEKVLGISSSELNGYDLVRMIEAYPGRTPCEHCLKESSANFLTSRYPLRGYVHTEVPYGGGRQTMVPGIRC